MARVMSEHDQKVAWLITEMFEPLSRNSGGMEEAIAQMCASFVVAGENDASALLNLMHEILVQAIELLMDQSKIWDGLLPGGPPRVSRWHVVDEHTRLGDLLPTRRQS